eukprot:627829-Prymnesium_polylepis.1
MPSSAARLDAFSSRSAFFCASRPSRASQSSRRWRSSSSRRLTWNWCGSASCDAPASSGGACARNSPTGSSSMCRSSERKERQWRISRRKWFFSY